MMGALACSVWFTKENEHPGLLPLVLYFLNRYAALYWLVPSKTLRPVVGLGGRVRAVWWATCARQK